LVLNTVIPKFFQLLSISTTSPPSNTINGTTILLMVSIYWAGLPMRFSFSKAESIVILRP
jgi:hypothetical protein